MNGGPGADKFRGGYAGWEYSGDQIDDFSPGDRVPAYVDLYDPWTRMVTQYDPDWLEREAFENYQRSLSLTTTPTVYANPNYERIRINRNGTEVIVTGTNFGDEVYVESTKQEVVVIALSRVGFPQVQKYTRYQEWQEWEHVETEPDSTGQTYTYSVLVTRNNGGVDSVRYDARGGDDYFFNRSLHGQTYNQAHVNLGGANDGDNYEFHWETHPLQSVKATVYGGSGNDMLYAGNGGDTFFGQAGMDVLMGGWGADRLHGGDHADRIYAGPGAGYGPGQADVLYGDAGDDWLFGISERDEYHWNVPSLTDPGRIFDEYSNLIGTV